MKMINNGINETAHGVHVENGNGTRRSLMDNRHLNFPSKFRLKSWLNDLNVNFQDLFITLLISALVIAVFYFFIHAEPSFAGSTRLPGEDASDKLEAAGTLLKMLDTGLFKWGARLFAGVCVMSSAWALKEQRFAIAIICVIGAIIFGTAPKWVKNIFEVGDNQSLFSQIDHSAEKSITTEQIMRVTHA